MTDKRRGGRPPAPPGLRRVNVPLRLPEWLVQWMAEQPEAPASIWYWPEGQLTQLAWLVALWYMPAKQLTHAVAPLAPWNRPAAHPEHTDAPANEY